MLPDPAQPNALSKLDGYAAGDRARLQVQGAGEHLGTVGPRHPYRGATRVRTYPDLTGGSQRRQICRSLQPVPGQDRRRTQDPGQGNRDHQSTEDKHPDRSRAPIAAAVHGPAAGSSATTAVSVTQMGESQLTGRSWSRTVTAVSPGPALLTCTVTGRPAAARA